MSKEPRPQPAEQELPPRLRLFKHISDTFDALFSKALRDAPNQVNLSDYDEDEVERYKEKLEEIIANPSGRYIEFTGEHDGKFRDHDETFVYAATKYSDGLFIVHLADHDKWYFSGTEKADDYADVVISSEMQPFLVNSRLDLTEYFESIHAGSAEPDYLSDEDAQQIRLLIDQAELDIGSTLASQDFDWPDALLYPNE